jgi:putative tryptophan/tyrosine transport system substrate-binding protein
MATSDETAAPLASALVRAGWTGRGRRIALANWPAPGSVTSLLERRAFLATLGGGLLAAPLAAEAQQVGRVWRIGWLQFGSGGPRVTLLDALHELGYIEGKNITFEVRPSDAHPDRLPALAADLVRLNVDVIVAVAPPAILAAKGATTTIPILMAYWGGPDLVESGVVASLSRPGGNVTGVDMLNTALETKRLEFLLEAVPKAKNIAVIVHGLPAWERWLKPVRTMTERAGKALYLSDVGEGEASYSRAFEAIRRTAADALLVPSSPKFSRDRLIIIELAARHRIPAMYELAATARDGGLMAYSASLSGMDRQVAILIDKIIKGAKPADLPIEQPTKFEFAINLKTARALGLTIPPSLLLRADQVIE